MGIQSYGFPRPMALQKKCILPIVTGHDIVIQGDTCTGKTAAVVIGSLQKIDSEIFDCQIIILVPSHEQAREINYMQHQLGSTMNMKSASCVISSHI